MKRDYSLSLRVYAQDMIQHTPGEKKRIEKEKIKKNPHLFSFPILFKKDPKEKSRLTSSLRRWQSGITTTDPSSSSLSPNSDSCGYIPRSDNTGINPDIKQGAVPWGHHKEQNTNTTTHTLSVQ
ncbi:hypothetical protein NPIL_160101 [Nephila pilipes]|uniref:Uncharacterized protein n=1 Tax=Nephila pilipes TaxID=299642 RepID=A0A8X6JVX3_NEPPI|nr:hypothetical protein NPIL_160101 [Nephila pilipes]